MTITVTHSPQETVTLEVRPTARVGDVKKMVGEKLGTSVDEKRLFFDKLLPDESTCQDCRIKEGSRLSLASVPAHGKYIAVKFLNTNVLIIEVDLTDRIGAVKSRVQHREGTPRDQQRLIYGDRQMEDENNLADYGVAFGAVVRMVLRLRG
jgi:hypothetical protein